MSKSNREVGRDKKNLKHWPSWGWQNFPAQSYVAKPTYMFFTDFLHMFTFFKLGGRLRNFFCFCHKGLPLSKTYWMIVSPQKRVKKMPTICTCQTFIYYVNQLKTNFEVIFKAHFRAKKFQKSLWAHRPSKPTIGLLGMLTPMWGFVSLLLRRHVKLTRGTFRYEKSCSKYAPFHMERENLVNCN